MIHICIAHHAMSDADDKDAQQSPAAVVRAHAIQLHLRNSCDFRSLSR
jgi:hypothetical protein